MIQINVRARDHDVKAVLDGQSKWWIKCQCGWSRGTYSADLIRTLQKQHVSAAPQLDLVVVT